MFTFLTKTSNPLASTITKTSVNVRVIVVAGMVLVYASNRVRSVTEMNNIIAEAQEAFAKAGYQWQESVFNDVHPYRLREQRDCSVQFTKSTDPCAFGCGYPEPDDTVGWGRCPRVEAWTKALNWLRSNHHHKKDECSRNALRLTGC